MIETKQKPWETRAVKIADSKEKSRITSKETLIWVVIQSYPKVP